MNIGLEIIKIIFYLLLITGILYLFACPLKRKILKIQSSKYMRVVDRLYYDARNCFILLEINDELILLGQSEGKLEKLSSWNKSEINIELDEDVINNDNRLSNLRKFFSKFSGRKKGDRFK